jgi:hypothetical protein
VPGDTNALGDVFLLDRQTGQTTRVSVSSTGVQGNGDSEDATVSADGRYVASDRLPRTWCRVTLTDWSMNSSTTA